MRRPPIDVYFGAGVAGDGSPDSRSTVPLADDRVLDPIPFVAEAARRDVADIVAADLL